MITPPILPTKLDTTKENLIISNQHTRVIKLIEVNNNNSDDENAKSCSSIVSGFDKLTMLPRCQLTKRVKMNTTKMDKIGNSQTRTRLPVNFKTNLDKMRRLCLDCSSPNFLFDIRYKLNKPQNSYKHRRTSEGTKPFNFLNKRDTNPRFLKQAIVRLKPPTRTPKKALTSTPPQTLYKPKPEPSNSLPTTHQLGLPSTNSSVPSALLPIKCH